MMYKKCIDKYGGVFRGGVFLGGIFRGGIHYGGIWRGGIFRGEVLLLPIWYCFFLVQTRYFYHKKVVIWKLQHFYHKEVMMLLFLHRWDYCWKCEFDIDVKIENYNHHDGEQLLFYKNVHIKTQRKKKVVLVIFMLIVARNEEFQFIW